MSLIRLLLCILQVIPPSSLLSFWPGGLAFFFSKYSLGILPVSLRRIVVGVPLLSLY